MEPFDKNPQWHRKHITALENPISEFNARGGTDLDEYQRFDEHITTEHPWIGPTEWAAIQAELPPLELVEDPNTGQKLRVQKYNWPKDGDVSEQTVTFMNMPFSVPADPDHIQYEHSLVAKELATPFVVFENPGYGDSDKLTATQKEALKHRGDFGPVGESMLGIASTLGARKVNLMGYSMGAETAAAMAAHASDPKFMIEVENLFVMEGPRVTPHNKARLAADFMSDAGNLKFTWKHPVDPTLREVGKLKPALPKSTVAYGFAMTKAGQEEDLRLALATQPNMRLTIASAGASKISPSGANNDMYDGLRHSFPDRSIRRIVIPGEGHAYGDSGKRYAHLGKLVLR